MHSFRKQLPSMLVFLALLLLSAACSQNTAPDAELTVIPEASPTAEILKEPLVVCLGEAPSTLYPYGDLNASAETILPTLYDNPVDLLSYQYQAGILTGLPSLSDGSAQILVVEVQPDVTILAADGQTRPLKPGVRLRPAGCRSDNCAQVYTGEPIQMEQLTVTFQMRNDLAWADGTPADGQRFGVRLPGQCRPRHAGQP